MKIHDCSIGIYWEEDGGEMVTLEQLQEKLKENRAFAKWCRENKIRESFCRSFDLSEYADGRKNIGFTKFRYCPNCGRSIDWYKIKRMEESK